MINLPAIYSLVTIGDKVLRQGDNVRIEIPEIRGVLNHADGVRTGTRHEACLGWTANCLLAIGAIETQSIGNQRVENRKFRNEGTVATRLGTQIINRNKKNVWPAGYVTAGEKRNGDCNEKFSHGGIRQGHPVPYVRASW
jgi:hypothetical protein